MPRGGARVRSGPPPDPFAVRRVRRDAGDWLCLPAGGRPGAPPEWPLVEGNEREAAIWTQLWARPQAVVWERAGQEFEVALYVRRLTEAELPGAATGLSTLVRQMSDSLGLTTPGMRSNRWRIEDVPEAPAPNRARNSLGARDRLTPRERLVVVDADSAEDADE